MREYMKAARKAKKLTQEQAAQAIGLSRITYNAYERGRRVAMPVKWVRRISNALDIPVDVILENEAQIMKEAGL